jgi:hypothetical protein
VIEATGKPLFLDINYADPTMLTMASPFRFDSLEARKVKNPEVRDFFASAFHQATYDPTKVGNKYAKKSKQLPEKPSIEEHETDQPSFITQRRRSKSNITARPTYAHASSVLVTTLELSNAKNII